MVDFLQHSPIVDAERNAREVMQVLYCCTMRIQAVNVVCSRAPHTKRTGSASLLYTHGVVVVVGHANIVMPVVTREGMYRGAMSVRQRFRIVKHNTCNVDVHLFLYCCILFDNLASLRRFFVVCVPSSDSQEAQGEAGREQETRNV